MLRLGVGCPGRFIMKLLLLHHDGATATGRCAPRALVPRTHAPPDRSTTCSSTSDMSARTATRKTASCRDLDTRTKPSVHANAPTPSSRTGTVQLRDFGAFCMCPAYSVSPRKPNLPMHTTQTWLPTACGCLHWLCKRLRLPPASVLRCTALGREPTLGREQQKQIDSSRKRMKAIESSGKQLKTVESNRKQFESNRKHPRERRTQTMSQHAL